MDHQFQQDRSSSSFLGICCRSSNPRTEFSKNKQGYTISDPEAQSLTVEYEFLVDHESYPMPEHNVIITSLCRHKVSGDPDRTINVV